MKFKVEIELDLNFEEIFAEIPEGLFSKDSSGPDEYYYRETICNILRKSYLGTLTKDMDDIVRDKENGLYKYLKHHNKCQIETSKQLCDNVKITKIE